MTILFVGPTPVPAATEACLTDDRCVVIDADTGERAVEIVQCLRPDVIVLRGHAVGWSPADALRVLRTQASTRDLPVAILVSRAGGGQDDASELETDAVLTAPLEPGAVAEFLTSWRRRTEQASSPLSERANRGVSSGGDTAIDLVAVRQLAGLAGETAADLLTELIDLFETNTHDLLATIRDHVRHGRAADIVRPAHSVAGSASTVGASGLAGLAKEIERLGRTGEIGGVLPVVDRIETALPQALADLRALSPASRRQD